MKSKLHLTLGVVFASASFSVAQQTSTTVWNVVPTDPITPGNWAVAESWTAGVPTTDSLAGILNGDTVTVNAPAVTDLEQLLISGGSILNVNALVGVQGTNGVPAVVDPPTPAVPATGLFVATGTLNVNANGEIIVNTGGNFTIGNSGAGVLNLKPDGFIETDRLVTFGTSGGSAIVNQTGGSFRHSVSEFRLSNNGPATYNLSDGILDVRFLKLGHGSNAASTMNQTGGDVTVSSGETAIGWDGTTGGNATYNLSGGTLTATVARMRIGIGAGKALPIAATHIFNQTGGTVKSFRIEIGEKINWDSTYAISAGELTCESIPGIIVGANADGFGKLNISGTAVVNVKGINVGNNTTASGTVTMSDGTVNSTDRIRLRTGTVAMTNLFNQTGGTVNTTNRVDIGDGTNALATCIYQISGGALNMTGGDKRILVGFGATSSTGTFTMSGTATVDANLVMGEGAGAKGTINLNGGTLTTGGIQVGTGVPANQILNLNGVTLKPRAGGNTLIAGNVTTASLLSGGVTVDSSASNGLDPMNASMTASMSGLGGLTKKGTGTLTVNSAQTYTGDTIINAGTLALPNVAAINVVASSQTGTSEDLSNVVTLTDTTGLVPGQTVTGPGFTGTVTITAVSSPTTVTVSANASAANSAGAGTFNFGAFSAAARVGALADAGTVRINGVGSILSLATGINDTVNALVLDGVPAAAGTWGSNASAADNKNDDHFSGAGILTVTTVGVTPSDFDNWAAAYLPANVSDKAGDNDKDGLNNFQEYAFGLNPINGSSMNPISQPLNKATGVFKYTRRATPASTLVAYTYESSMTLNNDWLSFVSTPVETSNGASPVEEITVTIPPALLGNPKLFIQVKAMQP